MINQYIDSLEKANEYLQDKVSKQDSLLEKYKNIEINVYCLCHAKTHEVTKVTVSLSFKNKSDGLTIGKLVSDKKSKNVWWMFYGDDEFVKNCYNIVNGQPVEVYIDKIMELLDIKGLPYIIR
jgi:hypothetical protein